jgi:hypothetical protein
MSLPTGRQSDAQKPRKIDTLRPVSRSGVRGDECNENLTFSDRRVDKVIVREKQSVDKFVEPEDC